MSLKDIAKAAKAKKSASSVISLIDTHLATRGGDQDRRDFKFHPSDLSTGFCPRAWLLYHYHPEGLSERDGLINPRLWRIFGNGHGVHDRIQGYMRDIGILWGRYHNVRTGEEWWGFGYDLPEPRQQWVYTEVPLRHDGDDIKGHTDGLLKLDTGKWVLEIKSINDYGFSWLQDEAKEPHQKQGRLYEHCLAWRRENIPHVDDFDAEPIAGVIFLYESKNTQDLFEAEMPADPDEVDELMGELRPLMEIAREWIPGELMPACTCTKKKTICSSLEL